MQLITVSLSTPNNKDPIMLGHQGENLATTVQFDITAWVQEYGEGDVILLNQRKGETPYPVVVAKDGNIVTWEITNIDTGKAGTGWCELRYYVGNVLVKSDKWMTLTKEALGEAGKTPEPWEGFLDQVSDLAAQAAEDADAAEKAAKAIEDLTVSAHSVAGNPTVEKSLSKQGVYNLDFGIPSGGSGGETGLPSGGMPGQYLMKQSNIDGDAVWASLPVYDGSYEATPLVGADTIMQTSGTYLDRDLVLKAIPYQETSNLSGGKTAVIGGTYNG